MARFGAKIQIGVIPTSVYELWKTIFSLALAIIKHFSELEFLHKNWKINDFLVFGKEKIERKKKPPFILYSMWWLALAIIKNFFELEFLQKNFLRDPLNNFCTKNSRIKNFFETRWIIFAQKFKLSMAKVSILSK